MDKDLYKELSAGPAYAMTELKHRYEKLQEAVNAIDARAALLTGISASVAGAIVAAGMLPSADQSAVFGRLCHIVAGLSAAVVLFEAVRIWTDRRTVLAGKHQEFWNAYVASPKETFKPGTTPQTANEIRTYRQSFGEYSRAVNELLSINEERGRRLQRASKYFLIQLVAISFSMAGPWVDALGSAFWAWVCGPAN